MPLLQLLDQCPPFVCYYAAQRNRDRRPSVPELVEASGMSQRTFLRVAHRTTWANVSVKHMSQFCVACGIDPLDAESALLWLAKRHAAGKLTEDFAHCRGQGESMIEKFNALASKAVLQKEQRRG